MSRVEINWVDVDNYLRRWLQEDIGRGDQTTLGLGDLVDKPGQATWVVKASGVVCGLLIAQRVFQLLNDAMPSPKHLVFESQVAEGTEVEVGSSIAHLKGPLAVLLTGERVALNLAMHLSGIATTTFKYVNAIADLPTQFVDTRKTTPGLRILEKYATRTGGARNHRMGLDDGVMIKDNHIAAAGGITQAIQEIRSAIPYPLTVEVETENLAQVQEALRCGADIIMLDNMPLDMMQQAVQLIREHNPSSKIEGSGNVTLETIREMALTGVDYISSSAPITRSAWLDLSMRLDY